MDHRCLLGAHVSGKAALSSGTLDALGYNEIFDRYRSNLCVMAVECTDVSEIRSPGTMSDDILKLGSIAFNANMKVLDVVLLLDTYQSSSEIKELDVFSQIMEPDGTVPFEKGKTYLIRGFFEDYPIAEVIDKENSGKETGFRPYQKTCN